MLAEENPLPQVTHAPLKKPTGHRHLAFLVLVSFVFFVAALVIRIGIDATPYESVDSAGRPMGFNDPLSAGHYLIMLAHFHPAELLKPERAYEWMLFAMQACGAWLLLSRAPLLLTRAFFAAQAALFPLGLLFCWFPPLFVIGLFTHGHDREGFTDFDFVVSMGMIAHATWVVASLLIVFALRGPGLELSRIGHALADATHMGGRTFLSALRQEALTQGCRSLGRAALWSAAVPRSFLREMLDARAILAISVSARFLAMEH